LRSPSSPFHHHIIIIIIARACIIYPQPYSLFRDGLKSTHVASCILLLFFSPSLLCLFLLCEFERIDGWDGLRYLQLQSNNLFMGGTDLVRKIFFCIKAWEDLVLKIFTASSRLRRCCIGGSFCFSALSMFSFVRTVVMEGFW